MRYKQLLSEKQLDEVRMSPGALRSFAKSPEAEGIKIGFEAEIIFPGLGGAGDSGDYEPDYDYDERTGSIDDIINFFEYDDFGMGLSDRESRSLRGALEEEYWEWRDSIMMQEFDDRAYDLIRDYIEENEWDEEERILDELEGQGLDSGQIEEIMRKAREATSTKNTPKEYLEAAEAVNQELDARAELSRDDQDEFYDAALDEFRDDWDTDDASEDRWLRDRGFRYMSDVQSEFNLGWPYMRLEDEGDGFDEYNAQQLADDLERTLDVEATVSGGYHSATRDATTWIFEPDSSLEPESGDMPVEIVSPPMPLDEGLVKLREFFKWAKENRAYTNSSTGFHMGVSLPVTGGKTDFIKLALFLGDEHVLKEFGRLSNHFTESAMKKIRNKLKYTQDSDQISNVMNLMRSGLIELATDSFKMAEGFGKYTSINPKGNYIEFRSAGGEDYSEDVDKLENTLLRYARAMSIAANPSAERKEYYKKLYRLIAPKGNNAALSLFAKYAAGDISAEELKKEWADEILKKEAPDLTKTGTWKIYDKATGKALPGYQYAGYTEQQAFALAKQAMSPGSTPFGFKQMFDEKYELRNVSASTGRWAIIDRASGETLEVVDSENRGDAADLAMEKYAGKGIDYYIEPVPADAPKPKLSRRAELAKRIKSPKADEVPEFTHYLRNKLNGRVEHLFRAPSSAKAYEYANQYSLKHTGQYSNFSSGEISSLLPAEINRATELMKIKAGNYYIADRNTGEVVQRFYADDNAEAVRALNQWRETHPGDFVYGQTRFLDNEPAQTPQTSQTPAGADVQWRVTNNQTGDSSIIRAPSRLRANSMVIDLARRMGVDFENFTIEPYTEPHYTEQQTLEPGQHWELFHQSNEAVAHVLSSRGNRQEAAEEGREWIRAETGGRDPRHYGLRAARTPTATPPEGTPTERRADQVTTDSGVPMWEIYDRRYNQVVARFPDHNQTAAWSTGQQWLRDNDLPQDVWSNYSVRPQTATQPVPGSTQDRQQQRAAGEFTGAWKIVDSDTGQELHRFSGVGNVQADANRAAIQWLLQNGPEDVNMTEIEVVPIMGESLKLTKNILSELNDWVDTISNPKNRK